MKKYKIEHQNHIKQVLNYLIELKYLFGDWSAIAKRYDYIGDSKCGVCIMARFYLLNDEIIDHCANTFIKAKSFNWHKCYPVGGEEEYFHTTGKEKFENPIRLEYIDHCILILTNIIENKFTEIEA